MEHHQSIPMVHGLKVANFQSMNPGKATSASTGNLLEMQFLISPVNLLNQTLGVVGFEGVQGAGRAEQFMF